MLQAKQALKKAVWYLQQIGTKIFPVIVGGFPTPYLTQHYFLYPQLPFQTKNNKENEILSSSEW